MTQVATINPLNQFFDQPSGLPLTNGKIYIGEENKDPEQFPITVYWDEAGLVPAIQPIRTTSGYPTRNGSPAILYVNSLYSMRVRNQGNSQVFYIASAGTPPAVVPTPFIDTGLVPSFATANTFTVTGDQTSIFLPDGLANLRVRMTLGSGFVYGTVTNAGFGALTTVTLTMDSTSLDASLSAVATSFLQPSPNAIPESTIGAAVRVAATQAAACAAIGATAVRQTVLSGPVDSNGFSAFVGATGSTTVTATGTLKATAAAGGDANYTGSITNPSWTGLSTNGTMYLFLNITGAGVVTTGSTTLAPTYRWGGADVVTNLQNTFNIQEMAMKVGNGATATQVFRVFVGEVTVAGAVTTAIVWYQLMDRYDSNFFAVTTNTLYSKNANIGKRVLTKLIFSTTATGLDGGGLEADPTGNTGAAANANYRGVMYDQSTRNVVRAKTTDFFQVADTGGNQATLTSGFLRMICTRGW
jgi:hypothetical protein